MPVESILAQFPFVFDQLLISLRKKQRKLAHTLQNLRYFGICLKGHVYALKITQVAHDSNNDNDWYFWEMKT
jgi:hypothetical protein